MTAPVDCHLRRSAELVAALGAQKLGSLLQRYADDLAGLAHQVRNGGDAAAMAASLHRLQGSGSTLGLDGTSAALADAAALLSEARTAAAVEAVRPAIIDMLAQAEACRARGWAALDAAVPGLAGHSDGASKR